MGFNQKNLRCSNRAALDNRTANSIAQKYDLNKEAVQSDLASTPVY
jgi:hypothetical protein